MSEYRYNELDSYERKIEENAEKFKSVENVEYLKNIVKTAAENTVKKKKRLVLEFERKLEKEERSEK